MKLDKTYNLSLDQEEFFFLMRIINSVSLDEGSAPEAISIMSRFKMLYESEVQPFLKQKTTEATAEQIFGNPDYEE